MCVEAHCTVCDANLTSDGDCLACEDRMIDAEDRECCPHCDHLMGDGGYCQRCEDEELEVDMGEYCPSDDGDLGYYEDDQPEWME